MSEQMQVGALVFLLHRKAIKNLHINVLPPDGFVRVSAPQAMTETAIRTAVISRLPWIRRQQQAFAAQPRQPEREMVSGESHFLWGRKYRLDVVEQMGRHQVRLQSNNCRATTGCRCWCSLEPDLRTGRSYCAVSTAMSSSRNWIIWSAPGVSASVFRCRYWA